jgi:hypothetical protein
MNVRKPKSFGLRHWLPGFGALAPRLGTWLVLLFAAARNPASAADAVDVTVSVDKPVIRIGETTRLRFWGTIAPAIAPDSDRIFSWYVDALNSAPEVVAPLWDQLLMPGCDSPTGSTGLSSRGATAGADRVGIRNTFLSRPGAGKVAPIQLFEVELTGVASGQAMFSLRAGTGTPTVAHDFQVARLGGGAAFTGGTYTSSVVIVTVDGDDDGDGLSNNEEAALGSNPQRVDTDSDGLDDLQEFAFGSSPSSPSSAHYPVAATALLDVAGQTAEYQEIKVRRRVSPQSVAFHIESSQDSLLWQSNAVLVASVDHGDGTRTETFRAPASIQTAHRTFLRARVSRQ